MDLSLIQVPVEELDSPGKVSTASVKVQTGSGSQTDSLFDKDTILKVVLTGIAKDSAEVAALISRLEQSEYFDRIVPVFSRDKEHFDTEVSEFEIRCVVADFIMVN